jgi:DNA polymerase III subunit delta'
MILHPDTARAYQQLLDNPSHALLILGEEGAGKMAVAMELARHILKKTSLDADSTFRHFTPVKGSLGIDQVRELQKFLHLRTTGTQSIRRLILIEDAHLMTIEGQNALLKILEEPPADTVIILTAIPTKNLLSTIYSRAQQLILKTPSLEQTLPAYPNYTNSEVEKAYMLSNGQQGLLFALLEHSREHELVQAIDLAKSILGKTKFERLAMVDELARQKTMVMQLIKALKRIAHSALLQSAKLNKDRQARDWHSVLLAAHQAEGSLKSNPNMKLLLTNLMLTI